MLERILLVDDDNDFRSEFKEYFEEYEIREARNGNEALALLKKPNRIKLVILDIRMPGLNGIEVLKEIRKINSSSGVIIFTGYSSKNIIIDALRNHADDYIEKPLDFEKTRRIIERVLDKKEFGETADITDTKWKIEKVKRLAERNCFKRISLNNISKVVYMSPKYLSRIFLKNTGIAFTKYRLNVMMRRVRRLLKQTAYSIDDIGDKAGYLNIESFIRTFSKLNGCTPAEYRKRNGIEKITKSRDKLQRKIRANLN